MINCNICGAASYPGTLFCKECGGSLFTEPALAAGDNKQNIGQLHYLLPVSGRRGVLNTSAPIWVGRADPDQGFWPGLDLTDVKGLDLGVSRRHALIQEDEESVVIVDQDSANGTWIDQERLIPNHPHALPDTAAVRFGRLVVHFFKE